MFSKCLLLLFFSTFIDAQFSFQHRTYGGSSDTEYPYNNRCMPPQIANGRVRFKNRSRMIKFICMPKYELVGNRYATCRGGSWDSPKPICVRPGCLSFTVSNGIQIRAHHEAWVTTFCMPGYKLLGSAVTFCNGFRWNATAPKCVSAPTQVGLSCDFEDTDMCGWMQDDLHDFDWTRINSKTPTSFLNTGPKYDHTLGKGGKGYYMFIESSSRRENSSARLLSPVFEKKLTADGCFSFFYHMFGRTTGGLRVYQKPDGVQMSVLTDLPDSDKQQYILFEQWGNLGDFWYSAAPPLKDFDDDFQIVIEGIRGSSFTSDIAIDDVALLQGENCTNFRIAGTTPVPPENAESCAGRCHDALPVPSGCECSMACVETERCCADFYEICAFNQSSSDDDMSTTGAEQPQTEKLVLETTTPHSPSPTTSTTTPKSTDPTKPTTIPTTKPTTKSTTRPTIKSTTKTTITLPRTKITTTTTTTPKSTTVTAKTAKTPKITTHASSSTSTPLRTRPTQSIKRTTTSSSTTKDFSKEQKEKSRKEMNVQKMTNDKLVDKSSKSSGWKTAVITILVLAMIASIVYLGVVSRTNRGRVALARLRGRVTGNDSEVRYLNAEDDDL